MLLQSAVPNKFKLFNLIIELHNSCVQTYPMSIDPPKGFELRGREGSRSGPSGLKVMPIVAFNAVEQFVGVLREKYDNLAWFFYDKFGQRIIGVTMKPGSEKLLAGDLNKFIANIKEAGSKMVSKVSLVRRND